MTPNEPNEGSTRATLLDELLAWATTQRARLAADAIRVASTRGPTDRDPRAAWVDFDTATRCGRLIVWTNGMAQTTVYDLTLTESDPLVFVGTNEVRTPADLLVCLADLEQALT